MNILVHMCHVPLCPCVSVLKCIFLEVKLLGQRHVHSKCVTKFSS